MQRGVLIVSLALLAVGSVLAGGKRVTVHVEGVVCPFCTFNLEKRIKTLEGAAEPLRWQASIEKGISSFEWKEDVPVDALKIREEIRRAGFTADRVEVALGGTRAPAARSEVVVALEALSCEQCSPGVLQSVAGLPGVVRIAVDFDARRMRILFAGAAAETALIRNTLESAGYVVVAAESSALPDAAGRP